MQCIQQQKKFTNQHLTVTKYSQCHLCFTGTFAQLKGSVKETNKFHNYETEKITRKASDVAEYIEFLVLPTEIVMHDTFNVIH